MENTQLTDKKNAFKEALAAFTEHPRLANETYFQHLCFTLKMSGILFCSAFAILLHGIFPFVCTHTASNKIVECNKILCDRAEKTRTDRCETK